MEKELNIAAILKEKPKGLKLWSPAVGKCSLRSVDSYHERVHIETGGVMNYWFDKKGFLFGKGERLIFPSKQMRDWSKFAWKKGDVLCCGVDNLCIFKSWANNSYTEFNAMYVTNSYASSTCPTEKWTKETNEVTIKQYIAQIEEIKGGKLNLSTLDIKQPKQEFKDGDIVYLNTKNGLQYVFACDANKDLITSYIVAYCITLEEFAHIETQYICRDNMINRFRLATDSEKQQLFDALAKEGKAWDAEKKAIVDLPKKCEFKVFQKVLVRDIKVYNEWRPAFFHKYKDGKYFMVDGCSWEQCIPYNDSTKHLLGTTDE